MNHINTVFELVQTAALKYSERDFCRFIRNDRMETRTYSEFFSDSQAICRYIKEKETAHIHIGFIGTTNYEYIACLTGMIMSGNTVVPFSPDTNENEAVFLFNDAEIEILFCETAFMEKALKIKENCTKLRKIISLGDYRFFDEIFKKYADERYSHLSEISIAPDSPALIIYTSGTTGVKKGVMLSNRNLAANSTYNTYAMTDGDVSFSILPMHHIFCYACDVLKTLYDGGTLCLNGNPADLYKNFLIFEPTVMRIVPAICRSILTRIKIAERRNPLLSKREAAERVVGKNLRRMIAGSAFLSSSLIDAFEAYGITARQGYGMSECSPRITTADFSDACKYSNGILTGVDEVRVCDGEIQVRGPSVMLGYYKREKETADAFTNDGFLHTGDMGFIENGHIYLTGRKKNIIVLSNGENISPETIENRFADELLIKEIIVFADKDKICAEIYPEKDATEKDIEEIIHRINCSSDSDKQIERFTLRATPFEKTSTGKIKRQLFSYKQGG